MRKAQRKFFSSERLNWIEEEIESFDSFFRKKTKLKKIKYGHNKIRTDQIEIHFDHQNIHFYAICIYDKRF